MLRKIGWMLFDGVTVAILIVALILGAVSSAGPISDVDVVWNPLWDEKMNVFNAAYAMAISGTTLAGVTIIPVAISVFVNFFKHKKEWGWAILGLALAIAALGIVIFAFVKNSQLVEMIEKNPKVWI